MTPKNRIESIDVLRGIAMVIMALDHVRDYFHITSNTDDPLNLATTTTALYFTRWITHFCAPIFVFLSGTSAYLQSLRKTKKELGTFLLKRGCWLIAVEWTIVAFAWTFNPAYHFIPFQVIWAIGISMVILGLLVLLRLPLKMILVLGVLIVSGHNLLDFIERSQGFKANFYWDIAHHGMFAVYNIAGSHNAIIVYPFLPWAGLMMIGYCTGVIFTPAYAPERRMKILYGAGVAVIVLFIALRFANVYGDPGKWQQQKTGFYTFLSFINLQKYPPSLLYLCATIGPSLLMLALLEKTSNSATRTMAVYGRTAFFYYILHIYIIHVIAAVCFFVRGHSFADASDIGGHFPFLFVAPGEGYGLRVVYIVWLAVVVLLYPLCRWYDKYKRNNKEKWWLSYL